MYKKAERLAKVLQMLVPALASALSLKAKAEAVAIELLAAASPGAEASRLPQQLLALSGLLSLAQTAGLISIMNTELITREAQALLAEIERYEEPRMDVPESPSLLKIGRNLTPAAPGRARVSASPKASKGHLKDIENDHPRREAILTVLKDKGSAGIRDIALFMRGVGEKTLQRELQALVAEGIVSKRGERRWSTYRLA